MTTFLCPLACTRPGDCPATGPCPATALTAIPPHPDQQALDLDPTGDPE